MARRATPTADGAPGWPGPVRGDGRWPGPCRLVRGLPRSARSLGATFACLAAFVLASVLLLAAQQDHGERLRETLRVETLVNEALALVQDEAIGQRGYLLTGDDVFLAPYRDAKLRVAGVLDALREATAADPSLSADVSTLRELSTRASGKLAEALDAYRSGDRAGAVEIVRRREGNDLVAAIRDLVERMDARTDASLVEQRRRFFWTGLTATAAIAVALALMGLVAFAALAEVRRRARLTRFLPAGVAARLAEGDDDLR